MNIHSLLVCLSLANFKFASAILCGDDIDFKYEGSDKKTCKRWVSRKRDERCLLDGVADACKLTCGTCDCVDDPDFFYFPEAFYLRAPGKNCTTFVRDNDKNCNKKIKIGGVKSKVKDHCRIVCDTCEPPICNDIKITAKRVDDSGEVVDDCETAPYSTFGVSAAIFGNTMAIVGRCDNSVTGAVYLYQNKNSNESWDFEAKLELFDDNTPASAVAMTSNVLVVGASNAENNKGSVYVMTRDAEGAWVEFQELIGSDSEQGIETFQFGARVEVSEDLILVSTIAFNRFVFFFEKNDDEAWVEVKKIENEDLFGVSNDLVVTSTRDGVVSIYSRSNSKEWEKIQEIDIAYLYPSSISVSENTIAVGVEFEMENGVIVSEQGLVYILTKGDEDIWGWTQTLVANDAGAYSHFGSRVSITGDNLVVGAMYDDNERGDNAGAAYVFSRERSGDWVEKKKVLAEDGAAYDQFGGSVSASGTKAVIGWSSSENGNTPVYVTNLDC